jgi:hypothetical protein
MTLANALRTPDDRLVGLPDLPHCIDTLPGYEGARAHYLDLGARTPTARSRDRSVSTHERRVEPSAVGTGLLRRADSRVDESQV